MRRLFPLIVLATATSTAAPAIVIRHDIEPPAYLADESRFPALFALYRTKAGHRDCIATLLSARWAITAAHCTEDQSFVAGLEADGYAVEIGGRPVRIDKLVRHGGDRTDVALVRLAEPVAWVAPLPLYRDADEKGRTVLIPGWGSTGNGIEGVDGSDGLFRIAENRVDAARDGWLIWRFDDPRSGVGGALALEGISGPGDSGGPAIIVTPRGPAVAGISSAQRTYGRAEGLYGVEEYFVRVSEFAGWIDEVMAQGDAPASRPAGTGAPEEQTL